MKMAKADQKDIDAAGDAMGVLSDISSGYYPKRDGDECEDTFFDPDDPAHLRKFFNLMAATLDKAPGWPSRVIGAMCYVILFGKNQIVDPNADTLELHPRFARVEAALQELQKEFDAYKEGSEEAFRAVVEQKRKAEECVSRMERTIQSQQDIIVKMRTQAEEQRDQVNGPDHDLDALRIALRAVLQSNVGRQTLAQLANGQGTATEEGQAWLAAAALVLGPNGTQTG